MGGVLLHPPTLTGSEDPVYFFFFVFVVDDGQDFVLAHDEVFLAIELDFLAGVLAEQDEVAGLHVERHALAVVLGLAIAGSDDFALLRLFLGGVGDDDPADFLFPFLDALNNDPVVQRSDVHAVYSVCREMCGGPSGQTRGAMRSR